MKPLQYRSKLFVDGCYPDKFAAALSSSADAVMLENEDHVAPELKDKARGWIADFIADPARLKGKVVHVRVNSTRTEHFHADLDAFVRPGIDIINLPKVESREQVVMTAELLDGLEKKRGLAPIGLLVNIETPLGLRKVSEIALAHPRVRGLQIGYGDLFKPYGISHDGPVAADVVRFAVRMAAAEAGIGAFDGAYTNDQDDMEAYRRDAERARDLGFTGKSCSNEKQVAIANQVFGK